MDPVAVISVIQKGETNSAVSQTSSRNSMGNPFGDFLQTDIMPADGFDFPFGDADGKAAYTDLRHSQSFRSDSAGRDGGDIVMQTLKREQL